MTEISITQPDNDRYPIYCQYAGQYQPQPGRIVLNPAEREIYADYNAEIGNAISMAQYHRRLITWAVSPSLDRNEIIALLDYIACHDAPAICDGYEDTWDGRNLIGTYTEDAEAGIEAVTAMLGTVEPSGGPWEASDWWSDNLPEIEERIRAAIMARGGNVGDPDTLAEGLASTLIAEAESDGVVLLHTLSFVETQVDYICNGLAQ